MKKIVLLILSILPFIVFATSLKEQRIAVPNNVRTTELLSGNYGTILGHKNGVYFLVKHTNPSTLSEPKSSIMKYTRISENDLSLESFEKEKLNFDKYKGVFLEAYMQGDFIYELYYAGPYAGFGGNPAAYEYIYLVRRDIENFEIIDRPKVVRKELYKGYDIPEMCVDESGVFIIDNQTNTVKRYDLELDQLWTIDVPFLNVKDLENNRQITSEVDFKERDKSLIIVSTLGKCNDCARSFFEDVLYVPSSSVSLIISKIDASGNIQSFSPQIKENLSYGRAEFFDNGSSITGIFEIRNRTESGYYFYKWNLETGEIIDYNKVVLYQKDILSEEVLAFGRLIYPLSTQEKIEEEKLVTRVHFELCERLEDGGFLLIFNAAVFFRTIFDSKPGSKLISSYRYNYMINLDPNGKIRWKKPSIFGGGIMAGYDALNHSNSIITKSNKLVTFGSDFSGNFEKGGYELNEVSSVYTSDCIFTATFDLSSGELLSVENIKIKRYESIIGEMYENDDTETILLKTVLKRTERFLIID